MILYDAHLLAATAAGDAELLARAHLAAHAPAAVPAVQHLVAALVARQPLARRPAGQPTRALRQSTAASVLRRTGLFATVHVTAQPCFVVRKG